MTDPGGQPTKMTDEKVKELEGYFSNGATDLEACFLAGISKQTLYNYQDKTKGYVDRKQALKAMTGYKAKSVIKEAIEAKDKDMAKWFAERKIKDYKNKTDITTDDKPIAILNLNEDGTIQTNEGNNKDCKPNQED